MSLRDLHPTPPSPPPGRTIAGPWPSYAGFTHLPDRERWLLYESAKRNRRELESQGFEMVESYDAFVQRVTRELDI